MGIRVPCEGNFNMFTTVHIKCVTCGEIIDNPTDIDKVYDNPKASSSSSDIVQAVKSGHNIVKQIN